MGLGRFLIWLSGARRQILEECPTDRAKYVGIGSAILVTASLAGVSLAFALVTALKVEFRFAVVFAFAWGVAILSLDRLFVVSMPRKGTKVAHLLRAVPRVLLALLLGFVISTPFVLQMFRPEIEHEITVLHAQAQQDFLTSQQHSQLAKNIAADLKRVNYLTNLGQSSVSVSPALNHQISDMEGQLQQATAKENDDLAQWNCQLYGQNGGTACAGVKSVGPGPIASSYEANYKADRDRVGQLSGQLSRLQAQARSTVAQGQASNAQQAKAQLPLAQSRLTADQTAEAAQTAKNNDENTNNTGLLIRMQALDAVTAGDSTLSTARWLLFVLFVVIDCMPVFIKVMLNLGPESNYDRMLEDEEKKQLRVAANNRAVRQAAEKLAAETVLGEAQSRLEGWRAYIPEVTQDIIAARTRVEARRIRDWENGQAVRAFGGSAPPSGATPGGDPPVGFIAWPWVTGGHSPRRWRPASSVRHFAVRVQHMLAARARGLRPRRTGPAPAPGTQPYGAPFSPGMPSSPNGVGHGAARKP